MIGNKLKNLNNYNFITMESLRQVLMRRDDLTGEEADQLIDDARQQVLDSEDPEEVLLNEFGLEPDYVFDLLY